MHVEKIRGEFFVIHNDKKIAGPFQVRETARAKMQELARAHNKRFLI